MDPDGSCPAELRRTKAFSYSLFNLNAWTALFEIARKAGEDLWSFTLPDGRGIRLGIEFLLPYLENPYTWKWPQIDGWVPADQPALQLGGLRLGWDRCREANKLRRGEARAVREQGVMGPQCLLPGYEESRAVEA